MKTRIFGALFVIVVLATLFIVTQESTQQSNQNYQPTQSSGDDPALRGLKIN